MRDAWRAYLELALGLTEASRKKAEQTARSLVGKGGATAAQLQAVAEDLLSAGTANRESLTRLVRAEVDRALGAVGLVKAEEVVALRARIDRLEADMERARSRAAAASAAAATAEAAIPPSAGPGRGSTGDATGEPATAATGQPAQGAGAEPAVASKAVAKKAAAKNTVAKKAVAKKAVAKKSPASKTVGRRSVDGSAGGR
ncbi:phasin family protein [Solwaraspora sp. WMMB762]|uniref:phasin family protein n=1 Tax=Solwaraspora sp. WMMB762 TaxID=3404120 RepID=UPI003B929C67